jgi:hypothetical protein
MDLAKLPVQSELIPEAWDKMFSSYFDHDELLNAVKYGWDLSFNGTPTPRDSSQNHPSAINHASDVDAYIAKELQFGAIAGPMPDNLPFEVFRSPMGSVPKPKSDSTRTITDCSQGLHGINNWIDAHKHRGKEWAIHLPTGDDIVNNIARVRRENPGKKVVLFKIDMSRYYRFFVVCPGQVVYLAIFWRGKLYLDRVFSFGNRGACLGSQRSSNAISWAFRTQVPPSPGTVNSGLSCHCSSDCGCGSNNCAPYVDDLAVAATEESAPFLFAMLLAIIRTLGFQPSTTPGNITPPSEVAVVLGVEYNLILNTVSLPAAKLVDLIELLQSWLDCAQATKREIKRLTGKLLYASRVVRPGRLFLGRMLDTDRRATRLDAPVPIDTNFRLDCAWWLDNVSQWNGVSILEYSHTGNVAVDASSNGINGLPGIGGFNHVNNLFFKCSVPAECQSWHISDLELLAHLVAARLWGRLWDGMAILGQTDNEATEKFLRSGRSRVDRRLVMGRTFWSLQHRLRFSWVPSRLSSAENDLADAASRWSTKEAAFWRMCTAKGIKPIESVVHQSHLVWSHF